MSLELTLNEPQINLSWVKSPEQLIYEFHNFRLDAEHLMLYRDDNEVSLTPKQVETLLALVERNGEIVRKDVLMQRLWGDTAVEEANLIQNIHFLRKELGNTPDGKPMIETLRRRGYRFSAELRFSGNGKIVSRSKAVEATVDPPWYQQRPVAIVLAALGLLGVVIVAGSFLFTSSTAPAGTRMQFAVLPLKPIDASNRSDIYEIGVADSLIHRLNAIKGFVVRPLSATRKYDAVEQDALAAGREQKVDHVIATNYQLADGKIRVTAQLINVNSGLIEDTYRVETAAGDVFALQDAVTDEIVKKLITRFDRVAGTAATKRGTNDEEAYRLYLQGKNLIMRRSGESARKAREYLEQAIRLDPNFASAYAQLARATPLSESEKIREYINRALELDPNLAEAYVARADRISYSEWDFQSVDRDLAKAIQLEPNNDTAHWLSAMMLSDRGRFDEALAKMDAAQEIDPGAVMYMFHRGRILYYARRYDEAIAQLRLAMDLDDRFVQPYGWTARVYEDKGDYATAFQFLLKREERSPRKDRIESFKKAYAIAGWMGARQHLVNTDAGAYDIARLHALNGEKDAAFEYLNKALEKREWMMPSINVEPAFDSLRDDARFDALVKCVGLK